MNFIAIDLELEQPNTNKQTPDSQIVEEHIIQVGFVVFTQNKDEPTILHSETMFLNYPGKLSSFIKSLTGITDEEVNASTNSPMSAVYKLAKLQDQFKTSRQIVEWGSGDVVALRESAGISIDNWVEKIGFSRSTINTKTLFQCYALANDLKARGGLSKSMGKLGLGFKNTHYNGKNRGVHWAESDALNTAIMFNKLINLMKKNENN